MSHFEFDAVIKVLYKEASSFQKLIQRQQSFILKNLELKDIYASTFMTSLDGRGFSITLLKKSDRIIKLLDDPATAPEWFLYSVPLQNLKEERRTLFVESKNAASKTNSSFTLDLLQFGPALLSAANH